VLTASLPSKAISILEEYGDKIDLLLTDVVMPEQTGPQLYECIREKQPDLRVLFMSGYPDNANILHKMLDPNAPFIQKPFKYESLGRKVREVLDEK
jgi:DNA-binding NtrC family response regulator